MSYTPARASLWQKLNQPAALFLIHTCLFNIGLFGIADVVMNFYFTSLGHSPETIGLVQGFSRLGGVFFGIPIGLLADRIGPRRITIYSMIGVALSFFMMVVFPALPMIFMARVLFGIAFTAVNVAFPPLVIEIAKPQDRTKLFSYHDIFGLTGTALGSVVGGFLPTIIVALVAPPESQLVGGRLPAQTPFAYGLALAICGSLAALSALPLLRFGDTQHEGIRSDQKTVATPRAVRERPPVMQLIYLSLPMLVFGVSAGLTFPFYNLFFRTRFSLPDQTVGVVMAIGWMAMGSFSLTASFWARRFGRVPALFLALCLAAVMFVSLGAAQALPVGVIAFAGALALRNMVVPLFSPLHMESVPPSAKNLASSFGTVTWNIGYFMASAVSGFWQRDFGFGYIMNMAAFFVILTGISIWIIFAKRKPYVTGATLP
jgi:MFS family permease